jgi:hypothetical protein
VHHDDRDSEEGCKSDQDDQRKTGFQVKNTTVQTSRQEAKVASSPKIVKKAKAASSPKCAIKAGASKARAVMWNIAKFSKAQAKSQRDAKGREHVDMKRPQRSRRPEVAETRQSPRQHLQNAKEEDKELCSQAKHPIKTKKSLWKPRKIQ